MTYLGDLGSAIMVEENRTDSMGGTQENQYVNSEGKTPHSSLKSLRRQHGSLKSFNQMRFIFPSFRFVRS